jgi:NADPH:quinone reductase-like Zn-dependent oxidoreductase
MHRVYQDSFGPPSDVLKLGDSPLPQPGPGQVRLKLVMSPIHNHDLMTIAGRYGYKPAMPYVPGTEALGIVDALGEGVGTLKLGQRVAGGATAAWAEYYLVDAARAVPVPDSIGDETACQMVSMPLSAKMVLHVMGAKAGDWVIQNAANGAVGKMVSQFAADQGINVVSLVRRAAGVEELAKVGIDTAIATDQPDWQEAVRELTKGAPIRFGIDSIGGPASDEIFTAMGEGSTLYSFGALTGRPLEISAANLLFKQARVEGFWLGKLLQTTPPDLVGKMIGEIVAKAATGALKLDIGGRFGLAEAGKACAASDVPGRPGKIVLVP